MERVCWLYFRSQLHLLDLENHKDAYKYGSSRKQISRKNLKARNVLSGMGSKSRQGKPSDQDASLDICESRGKRGEHSLERVSDNSAA